MVEKELEKFDCCKVEVTTNDGEKYSSICEFVSAEDNAPLSASIILQGNDGQFYEIYIDEIKSIKQVWDLLF